MDRRLVAHDVVVAADHGRQHRPVVSRLVHHAVADVVIAAICAGRVILLQVARAVERREVVALVRVEALHAAELVHEAVEDDGEVAATAVARRRAADGHLQRALPDLKEDAAELVAVVAGKLPDALLHLGGQHLEHRDGLEHGTHGCFATSGCL